MLDFHTGKVTSFASNDKELMTQHGTFEIVAKRTT